MLGTIFVVLYIAMLIDSCIRLCIDNLSDEDIVLLILFTLAVITYAYI